jgi:hypothetical protein
VAWSNAFPTSDSQLTTMAEWEALFGELAPSGVIQGVGSELAVTVSSVARTATIGTGGALIRGFRAGAASSTTLAIPGADSQNRIDRIVARLDRTAVTAADWIKPVIIEGTPSTSPVVPAIDRTTGANWDFPLARWTANSNGTISGLVDERALLVPTLAFKSTARPALAGPAVGLETDTGRPVTTINGSAWSPLAEDTGWVPLALTGTNGASWTNSSTRIRKRNGVVHLDFRIVRHSAGSVPVDSESTPINLAAAYRPTGTVVGYAFHGDSSVGIRVHTDGDVTLIPLATSIPASRTVEGSATWITD